jgi:hypothetical protein
MTGSDASSSEMPRVPIPGQVGRDQDELLLDMILDGRPLPPGAAPRMRALAENLVGLAAPPGAGELPGEAAAMAAYLRSGSSASTLTLAGGLPERQRRRRLSVGRARLAAAIAAVTVALSGTAAAAYAGALPASVQDFAHRIIDAPAAHNAAHHLHGKVRQRASHPGAAPSSSGPAGSGHPAKHGKAKGHEGRHHGRHLAKGKKQPKPHPTHPAHPAHPAHLAKAHPSHSPGTSNR